MAVETFTFLFTDIEGSTALLGRVGQGVYTRVLADHHAIIRSGLAAHGGREVNTLGDGFFAVFCSPAACVAAVIQMQQALAAHAWPGGEHVRVRMGVHTGQAAATATGLVGLDVHHAARVAAAGYGGQVLLSQASAASVREALPPGAALADLGVHRLKDLDRPEHIFQLRAAGLQAGFPPLRTVPGGAVPRQLPAAVPHFAGRSAELAALSALARKRAGGAVVIAAIGGTAGVGKTALAVHWAHQVADRFPDGQLYVNLRGFDPAGQPMVPAEAIRGFLDALGVPARQIPASLDAQAGLYRSLLAGRQILVLLDNARDSAQVRPLLPGAPGCLVLVTSRNQLTSLVAADAAQPIPLDLLTPAEARHLLASRLGRRRVAAEPQAVQEIITGCARLPLALAIVAARAAAHPAFPLGTLAAELRDSRDRLGALTGGDDPAADLHAVFSWSYRVLSPAAARLFRLLGLHPGPDIGAPAAASLAGLPPAQVRPLLAELADASLIGEHLPGRYAFHDLLRAYAAGQARLTDADGERREAICRVLDHYLHTACAADRLLDPHRDPITVAPARPGVTPEPLAGHGQALAWFTAQHPVLLAAVDSAASTGLDTCTAQLAWALRTYLDWQGHWHDQAAVQQAAITAARRLADPRAEARARRSLGQDFTELGRLDEARTHLRDALRLYGQAGDQAGQALTHNSLAQACEREGHMAEALHHHRQALHLYRAAGHRRGEASALNNVGWCHALLGDHEQALTACQQALGVLQDLGDRDGQAATWDSLGYAHHHLGHPAQAITCYQHALDLARDLGERYYQAEILLHLGDTHHATGDAAAARGAWQQALAILDDLDHPDAAQVRAKLAALNTPAAVAPG